MQDAVAVAVGQDPDPTDPFRGLYITDEHAGVVATAGFDEHPDDRLADLVDRMDFDEIDAAILGLVAAPDVAPGYGRLYAYLHDDVTRKLPSVGLITRLLTPVFDAAAVREHLDVDSPLRRSGVIRMYDERGETPLQDRPLRVADAVAGFLIGSDLAGMATGGRITRHEPSGDPLGRDDTVAEIAHRLMSGRLPLVVCGPDAIALVVRAASFPVLAVDVAGLTDGEALRDAVLGATIEGRLLVVQNLTETLPEQRAMIGAALDAIVMRYVICDAEPGAAFVLGGRPAIHIAIPDPSQAERREAWLWHSGAEDVEAAAAKYRLSMTQIAQASALAADVASADGVMIAPAHLDEGARQASGGTLGELATRVHPAYTWDQLILPERPLAMLRSIFGFVRHRDLVLSDWGYERALAQNQGIKVLFAGDSGTGKTMAAQVLGRELGLEIFRVDLATTVSKYIGETEKNLDRIFAGAEGSNAMLFFDEADALFGKRSDVGDAHDRYANLETAYLLQRMEGYPGAVILATNYRHNIDDAFLRRLDVVIDFPFPDERDRERIWRVALPASAPVADDLDLTFLATRFKLSGGGIRNASLAAAFLAADDGGLITMDHLVQGVANEYAKLGRLTMETEFERFHGLVTGARTTGALTTDDADAWALSSAERGPAS